MEPHLRKAVLDTCWVCSSPYDRYSKYVLMVYVGLQYFKYNFITNPYHLFFIPAMAPALWSIRPPETRLSLSLLAFRKILKTCLCA